MKMKKIRGRNSVRRGTRSLVQSIWAVLASTGIVSSTEINGLFLLVLVPVIATAISFVATEWEDKGGIRGFAAQLASGIREEMREQYG